ncbi:hypothetical protein Tco_0122203 [Tanacetum coccineum]
MAGYPIPHTNLFILQNFKNLSSLPSLAAAVHHSTTITTLIKFSYSFYSLCFLVKIFKIFPDNRKDLKICEANHENSSVNEPPELELKDLPPHLEYAFLEGDDKLPVIIAKDLKNEEKAALIKVLKSHKRAIAWKLSDIKGINPEFCTHKILMEEDYEPTVQHQRRVNPKIHDVIKKEVEKLLDAGLIYPISDSPWVSPVHCVPKKGGMTVVKNDENDLIPTRLVTRWRVCIDYRKLNEAMERISKKKTKNKAKTTKPDSEWKRL